MPASNVAGKLLFGNAALLAILIFLGVGVGSILTFKTRQTAMAQVTRSDANALRLLIDQAPNEPNWELIFQSFGDPAVRILRVDEAGNVLAAFGAPHDVELERMAAPELESLKSQPSVTTERVLAGQRWRIEGRRCQRGAVWVAHQYEQYPLIDVRLGVSIVAVALLLAVVNLSIGAGVARQNAEPLRRISEAARRLATGDVTSRADALKSGDLGALARAINEIRDRLAAHRETVNRQQITLDALLSQLHEGIVVATADGRIALINATALRMMNVTGLSAPTAEDCRRLTGAALERAVPRRDLQDLLRLESISTDGLRDTEREARVDESMREARIQLDQPGGDMHLLARASHIVLPGTGEQPDRGRLLVLTDITELARTVQIKSEFVANASHELRTPLTAIRSAIEALLDMDLTHERDYAQKFLRMIDRHSVRLIALVSDLLDLSKIESPVRAFETQRMDWMHVSRDLFERFENRITAKSIRWNCPIRGDGHRSFYASAYLLTLVLDNLVDNALKFTPEEGTITVEFSRTENEAVIAVMDSGCGIAPEHHRRVFERFYQVDRGRSGEDRGTGLGLSIVRNAVNAMRGNIELTSQPGTGTRFTLHIPQTAAAHLGTDAQTKS
ncbi:MAG: HAMP domain-containing protein [Phycisphaerales bacterium]|nr:HAMP domain-containing protein [Phycisphaerales bacterium]